MRAWRVQAAICLTLVLGVLGGDIAIAQSRIAAQHRRDAAIALRKAEAGYARAVNAISAELFRSVQPVQDVLDRLDRARPSVVESVRDAVAHGATARTLSRLEQRLRSLDVPAPLTGRQHNLVKSLAAMRAALVGLEKIRTRKDPSDILDEPFSGHAYLLTLREDDWHRTVTAVDRIGRSAKALTPLAEGSHGRRHSSMPTKAAWIFGADQACLTAGVALFKLGDIHTTDSLDTLVTHQQKYVEILSKVRPHIVALARPRADRAVLSRTVLGPLHTQDTYLAAVRGTTRALQNLDLAAFQSATSRMRLAAKGLSRVSHGLKAYGAEACGWFFDPHGPKIHRLGNGGGSGTISA